MYGEPSTFDAIMCGIGIGVFVTIGVIFGVYCLAEWWRTRRGSQRHPEAYGKGDSCEIKFISGGYGK